jgi:Ser/Thr protein kinase RdoA (MazF antagonist)
MKHESSISVASVRDVLRRYGFGTGVKIVQASTTGNISFIITAEKKKFFLRLCPIGRRERSADEIYAEISLLKRLSRNCFPIILPLRANDGREIVSIGKHHGYLRQFIDAQDKNSPSLSDIHEFGRTLGKYHQLIERYRPSRPRKHIFDYSATLRHWNDVKNEVLESEICSATTFVEGFEKEMGLLRFSRGLPRGFIHEDLGKRHVLWKGSDITAIIDFDRAYFGPLVLDLGQAIRGWCFVDDWRRFSVKNVKTLLAGYCSQRRLVRAEKECLVDSIKFAILERAQSFFLRAVFGDKEEEDIRFALDCVFRQVPLVENNRKTVQSLLD